MKSAIPFWVLINLLITFVVHGKASQDFFSDKIDFSTHVTTPESYLNYDVGEWHISPEALNGYMQKLAIQSQRASIETIGYSHERKAITEIYFSSPENIQNIERVRKAHLSAKNPDEDILVLKLGYSIHGNEASGSNAAPLVAYYLAASQEPWLVEFLKKTVVILEPSQNPDGLARFATWVNQHKGQTTNFDGAHREHKESWPSGRTNHYWFDLNRDWIFTVHPESQARINAYYKWRPHVFGDYHEMGGDIRSYFFQPGHAKRIHPNTPPENQAITLELARHHARSLDELGQPYYTEERFDDFYYGKGSAYPDATGAIGLLFEQSSVRGHARTLGGENITFSDGIANHLATSLSLIKGADSLRQRILSYRFDYQSQQQRKLSKSKVQGYVFSDDGDAGRAKRLRDILKIHRIPVYTLENDITINDHKFKKQNSWYVKIEPAKFGLIESLFDTRTKFEDTVFYDISTWNLPLAFNLPYAPVARKSRIKTKLLTTESAASWQKIGQKNPVAYAFEWGQLRAPHMLQALLSKALFPRLSVLPLSVESHVGTTVSLKAGTIIIQPTNDNQHALVRDVIDQYPDIQVHGLISGLTPKGPDLGSRSMKVIRPIRPALLVGQGAATTEVGEIRYAVDNSFGVPLTILDLNNVNSSILKEYSHLLMANGVYSSYKSVPAILKAWVKSGGVLIAQSGAAKWAETNILFPKESNVNKLNDNKPKNRNAYQSYEQAVGRRTIKGAVFKATADLTHPLLFGYNNEQIPIFYNAKKSLLWPENSYDTPLIFGDTDLLVAGYADQDKIQFIHNTPALAIHKLGKGKAILFGHNPNFRAIWLGTQKLYANALFFAQAIEKREDEKQQVYD